MKILFISPYLPSENSGHAGAQLICRNIKMLASQHIISIAAFINPEEITNSHELKELGVNVIPVLYERNRNDIVGKLKSFSQNVIPLIKSVLGMDIFFIAKYNRREMRKILIETKNKFQPDIVQFEYNVMHHFSDIFTDIPKILVQHDISAKVLERGAEESQTKFGRRKKYHLLKIAEKSERQWMKKFEYIITLTDEDKEYCNTKWKDLPPITVIPPQISVLDNFVEKNEFELCFIGSFNREPNLQALEVLLKEIFPAVQKEVPETTLKIAGKFLPEKIINKIKINNKVSYAGFVKNIDSYISESSLFIAPIKIGSGLKMKITHALACGTAVLTTSVGAEGIQLDESDGLWIKDNVNSMIEKCVELLKKQPELKIAGQKGKVAVLKLFSTTVIMKKWNMFYRNLIAK